MTQRNRRKRARPGDPDRPLFYKLEGQLAVPCSVLELVEWLAQHEDRHIQVTECGEWTVSTVFLTQDLGFGVSPRPLLFETMIYGSRDEPPSQPAGPGDSACLPQQWRYSTYAEALEGHERACQYLRDLLMKSDQDVAQVLSRTWPNHRHSNDS